MFEELRDEIPRFLEFNCSTFNEMVKQKSYNRFGKVAAKGRFQFSQVAFVNLVTKKIF